MSFDFSMSSSRSLALARASWDVLRQDRELLALPVMSAACTGVVAAPFVVALVAMSDGASWSRGRRVPDLGLGPWGYVLVFLLYLVTSFVALFFQAALVLAADERLSGGDPTLRSALSAAWARRRRIFSWSLVSATVSLVLRSLEERAGLLGRFAVSLVGLAWTLVTLLVLPVMVVEDVGVRDAARRSAEAFRRTWGENVTVNAGIGLVSFLALLAGGLVTLAVGALLAAVGPTWLVAVPVVVFAAYAVVVATVSAALSGVFRTALYRYAVHGELPEGFSQETVDSAFKPRRRSFRRSLG